MAVLLGVVFWMLLAGPGNSTANVDTTNASSSDGGKTELVLPLTRLVRSQTQIRIDGKVRSLPSVARNQRSGSIKDGEVHIELAPGEHLVVLKRRGYEQIEHRFQLTAGQSHRPTLQWETVELISEVVPFSTPSGTELPHEPTPAPPSENHSPEANLPSNSPVPPGYSGWVQGWKHARGIAAQQKKNILVAFVQSDADEDSIRLARKVFQVSEFKDWADKEFVLVLVDFPASQGRRNLVIDAAENVDLARRFGLPGIVTPVVAFADHNGEPYALDLACDADGEQVRYWRHLQTQRSDRDALFQRVKDSHGAEKLAAAVVAVEWILEHRFLRFYEQRIQQWLPLAAQFDPQNTQGHAEVLFSADWRLRLQKTLSRESEELSRQAREQLTKLVEDFDIWSKERKFKNANRAASIHFLAAAASYQLEQFDRAEQYVKQARAYRPSDDSLKEVLKAFAAQLNGSTGTGFVVQLGGYVVTNSHVIEGPGNIMVRSPSGSKTPAKVIAQDKQQDMALLKVDDPEVAKLPALPLTKAPARRGTEVAAFGFPLGDEIGREIKLTRGIISGVPDQADSDMLILDCRINPGNSGGPVCNRQSQVVGMVTKKIFGGQEVDSYGMAIPAETMRQFLRKHLPEKVRANPDTGPDSGPDSGPPTGRPAVAKQSGNPFQPVENNLESNSQGWSLVDDKVTPSVVMILKPRR